MTGFYITAGYQYHTSAEDCEEQLDSVATELAKNHDAIIAEVERVEPSRCSYKILRDVVAQYGKGEDLSITITRTAIDGDPDETELTVSQLASGGDPYRLAKEVVRRAFCRLLIERMNALGFNVNLSVS